MTEVRFSFSWAGPRIHGRCLAGSAGRLTASALESGVETYSQGHKQREPADGGTTAMGHWREDYRPRGGPAGPLFAGGLCICRMSLRAIFKRCRQSCWAPTYQIAACSGAERKHNRRR